MKLLEKKLKNKLICLKLCNWCFKIKSEYYFCNNCAKQCYQECTLCHRPFNNKKYFLFNEKHCNSCVKKYKKVSIKKSKKNKIVCTKCYFLPHKKK